MNKFVIGVSLGAIGAAVILNSSVSTKKMMKKGKKVLKNKIEDILNI